jgi:phage tail protein X
MFGDLLEDLGLSGFLSDGQWRTLKNGKRIKIDAEGRIVAGMPTKYHGTNIRDLSRLSHEERELEKIDCEDVGHCHTCRKTFRSKDEAVSAILQANPQLHELQQSELGAYDVAFLKWQRGGRRGPKPRTPITDGRLDAINEYYDLRGAARVGSFTEAIYHAVPSSKKWEDLEPRLKPLEEAAGVPVHLPDEALRLSVAKLSVEDCAADVDRRLAELFARAKAGPLEDAPPPASGDDVPF